MDPLTALGVASNIIQFVQFAGKLISDSQEAYTSIDGALQQNASLENAASSLTSLHQQLAKGVYRAPGAALSVAETQLQQLAKESIQIAAQLIQTLQGLKSTGKHKRWRSVRQAVASAWKQKDIAALQTRLSDIRQQLDTVLLICLRERLDTSEQNRGQVFSHNRHQSDATALLLKEIKSQHDELLHAVRMYTTLPSSEHMEQFSTQLEVVAELSIEGQFGKLILAHLQFAELQDRYERICTAHRDTFSWIFEEPDRNHAQWDDLSNWMNIPQERNFYWITGKAGSGKSTLMKYIYDDDRTVSSLKYWAGDHSLLTAGFFFWNSGIEIQMSGVGLLRTLLFQLLRQQPLLITKVFKQRWEAYHTFRSGLHEWTWLELKQALECLTQLESIRIAIFVDGLDEFEGDHEELADFLLRISGPSVKICAASRPWLVFEDAFDGGPNLLLEQLTRKDIRLYVTDQFVSNKHFAKLQRTNLKQASELIDSVVNKASGVFLWVNLVVRSLLQGMANADRMSDLKRRLDNLPTGLEELFDKLLRSLEPFYFPHAAQLIQILKAAPVPPTPLEMSYADDEDPLAAFEAPIRSWMEEEVTERIDSIRRRLNSRCKGLISVTQYENSNLERVEFLHRTVKDFFAKPDVWGTIQEATPAEFDPIQCWSLSILMELKTSDTDSLLPADMFRLVQWGLQHVEQSEHVTRIWQMDYLDQLDQTIKELVKENSDLRTWSVPEYFSSGTCFLDLVFQHGMVFYVKHKLHDIEYVIEDEDLDILLDTVANSSSPGSADLVRVILERGGSIDRSGLSTATTMSPQITAVLKDYAKAQSLQKPDKASWWRSGQLKNQTVFKTEGFWSL